MECRDEGRVEAWERRTGAWLTALAVVFLGVYAVPILHPAMPDRWQQRCELVSLAIWAVFVVDFVARFALHPARLRFVRTHVFDLVVLVLPLARPLRALRVVTAMLAISRRTAVWARGQLAVYVGSTTVLLAFVAALAVLDAERGDPDSNITSFPEALWWSVVTITTVGYGDHFPATTTGKLVAVGLMIGGIGLIGFVTGSLASWIVERVTDQDEVAEAARDKELAVILEELRELRREVAELRVGQATQTDPSIPGRQGETGQPSPG